MSRVIDEELVSAVSSRLCHDMATPIGTLGFAIEMNPALQQDEDLVKTYETLKGRLEIMREIFRNSNASPKLMECINNLKGFGSKSNISIEAHVTDEIGLKARLIFGLTWLLFESMHGGGRIEINSDGLEVKWFAQGIKGVFFKAEDKEILIGNSVPQNITNSSLMAQWLYFTATKLGLTIQIEEDKASKAIGIILDT